MLNAAIGLTVGLVAGAWIAYTYSSKLIADAQNAKARVENELAALKAAATAVKTDVEKAV